jgi:hypothetical protein
MPAINKMTRSVDESSYMKPKSAGLKALAEKNPELQYVGKAKMMDVRAKMAMPKVVDSSNFPKMAQDMAKAMDYNSSKPMMYGGDKPKMDYSAKMYKPKAYQDKK